MRRRPAKEGEGEEEDYDMFAAYPFLTQGRPSAMSFLSNEGKGEREGVSVPEAAVAEAGRPRRRKRKTGKAGRRPGLRRIPASSLPWVVRWALPSSSLL